MSDSESEYEYEDAENVVVERRGSAPLTPTTSGIERDIESEMDVEPSDNEVLEGAGIIKEGQIVAVPPPPTPSQQQKEYKRKMTEKRLESLKKAREAFCRRAPVMAGI